MQIPILVIFRAYYDIVDCYYVKTAKLCGKNAAELMKQLVLAVIDSVLVIKCEIKLNCFVSDAMPDDFKNSSSRVNYDNYKSQLNF